jgi:hypothetical protein
MDDLREVLDAVGLCLREVAVVAADADASVSKKTLFASYRQLVRRRCELAQRCWR